MSTGEGKCFKKYKTENISQLIEALQDIKNKYGNLKLATTNGFYDDLISGILVEELDGKLGVVIDVDW